MLQLGRREGRLYAITAAMPAGTGLTAFERAYPERTFDVGIAEGHAVSMAGGLAKAGMIPVVAIYSTFLQRAYDMILQDVAMLHLHVILRWTGPVWWERMERRTTGCSTWGFSGRCPD